MKQDVKIFMEDCVVVENKIYFFAKNWNALYVADIISKKTRLIGTMPEEKIFAKRLCAGIIYYDKKLILVPMTAEKIWIFDLENNQWNGIVRKQIVDRNEHQKEIFRAITYKEKLFFIGSNYPAIIQMNMVTYELKYLTEPYTFLMPLKTESQCYFRADFYHEDNHLLLASCLNNYVLYVDLDTFYYKWYEVGEKGFCYSGIAWDGECYWLSPRRATPIVKWNRKGEVEYIPLPDSFDKEIYNFLGVQFQNGKLVFPGMMQSKTIIIDPHEPNKMNVVTGKYLFYKCFEKGSIVSLRTDGLFQLKYFLWDKQYDMYCKIQLEELTEYLNENLVDNEKIIDEMQEEYMEESLPIYLSFLSGKKICVNEKQGIGEKVWRSTQN